jgi:hypothetical protein
LWFKASPGKVARPPAIWGSINRRTVVQAVPSVKQDPISKIMKAKKRARTWVKCDVECLPTKHKALNSNPSEPPQKTCNLKERRKEDESDEQTEKQELNWKKAMKT